ncbi:hypothetical protein M2403_004531 [Rahnella sp. BIGb0603]|uniref:hypothetical protein n=1 Tax=Rahnella sp. BIGb0603 TaxID=2940612 RepID=UPI0021683A02|nr:hypothetical protein [Rahnella sp. BIGb0603]MCS3425898.1 hypothetical protein [Rahnella sp. BIGb0603]
MKFIKFQRWVILKIMNGAETWNGMFTHEVNIRAIKAFQESYPNNTDPKFAAKEIVDMKEFYRSGMHVMLSIWLTAVSLFISVIALLVSIVALVISLLLK